MEELLMIKLGGSVITDKSREFTAREENIRRLAKEILEGQKAFKGKIIIGHGAGSFAHTPAAKYQTKNGIINKKSLLGAAVVEDAARKLNAIVIRNFLLENVTVFPFSPASFLFSDALVDISSYFDSIKMAIEIGVTPVVYGDVIMDKKQGFTIFSTEKIFGVMAKELLNYYKIRMIYVSDVDGVYNEKGNTIPAISGKNFDRLRGSIIGAKSVDVTGGMLHKVEESLKLAAETGIETLIINGLVAGNLERAVAGEKVEGTLITQSHSGS